MSGLCISIHVVEASTLTDSCIYTRNENMRFYSLILILMFLTPLTAIAEKSKYQTPDGAPGFDMLIDTLYDGHTGSVIRRLNPDEWYIGQWVDGYTQCHQKDTLMWLWIRGSYQRTKTLCLRPLMST